LKTYSVFFNDRGRFLPGMVRDNSLSNGAYVLRDRGFTNLIFYQEDAEVIRLDLRQMPAGENAIAVDTRRPYQEIPLGLTESVDQQWQAPHVSDWAIAIGRFPDPATLRIIFQDSWE